jgi:tRNA threonylcarbamoyladenosine biosynthesis protein TsaE
MKELLYSLDTIESAVDVLYALLPNCAVFTFTGTLGAGKTTLVQHLLRRCGVTEVITSPTFTYVNTYTTSDGYTMYHFDLYRMHSLQDFLDAGFDEYLYAPNSWAFIEWPEIVMPLLTRTVCHVFIDYYNNQRNLKYYIL